MAAQSAPLTDLQPQGRSEQPKSAAAQNGTDPTVVLHAVQVQYETIDLNRGFTSDTFRLRYVQPLGEKDDYSLRYQLPVTSVDVLGDEDYGFGDASVRLGHIFGLSRDGGYVAQGEMVFDTASRKELGTGQDVFKGSFTAARFLNDGAIFAPSFVQGVSLWGDDGRPDVNTTTTDPYYVPELSVPWNLLTLDPGSVELACASVAAQSAPLTDLQPQGRSEQPKSAAAQNGTDPTVVLHAVQVQYETIDLNRGFTSDTFRLRYVQPLGEKDDYSLRYQLPVTSVDVLGDEDYGFGDASVQLGHIFGLSREGGYVAQGEMVFDTASRKELGTGQNVFKGSFIAARFLNDGAIFAPSFVQGVSLWGDDGRPDVNTTTIDLYYVPKLSDPRNLLTLDPALNADWEADLEYLSFSITYGRVLGEMLGGRGIVTIKPSVFVGNERPGDWAVEVGLKVIGL